MIYPRFTAITDFALLEVALLFLVGLSVRPDDKTSGDTATSAQND